MRQLVLQRKQRLGEAASLSEEVARRAVRVVLAVEIQTGQAMERAPGLRMVAEELRALSEYATETAYQITETITDTQRSMQEAATEITSNNQMRSEIIRRSIGATSEIRQAFQLLEDALREQAHRLNQMRATIAHTQAAEEVSRAVQESGAFLQSIGSEAHLIAQAAGQLSQFEQRLLASLTPFKLSEPSGPSGAAPTGGSGPFEERSASASVKYPLRQSQAFGD